MQRSSRPSRRKPNETAITPSSTETPSTASPTKLSPLTQGILSVLLLCTTIACLFRPNAAISNTPQPYFNCTPPLPNLPPHDLPYDPSTLWDLNTMREYIRREQPGIEVYYKQQDKLETYLRTHFGRKPFVLELGGNNGWFADDLFPVLMAHEWPAIIVEALPHQYAQMVTNFGAKYHGCWWQGLQFVNIALVGEKTNQVSVSFQNTNGWQRGGGSVLRHQNEPGWQTMMVPGDTLQAVLKTVSYNDIDLIQIDIEGLDELILKQVDAIMHTIHPRIICIETCDTNYCSEFWTKHGFTEFRAPGQICGTRDF